VGQVSIECELAVHFGAIQHPAGPDISVLLDARDDSVVDSPNQGLTSILVALLFSSPRYGIGGQCPILFEPLLVRQAKRKPLLSN